MKKIIRMISACCLMLSLLWIYAAAQDEKAVLETQEQKLGYVLGSEIGASLKDISSEIEIGGFLKGIEDSFKGNDMLLPPEEASKLKEAFIQKKREEQMQQMKEMAENNKKAETEFLEKNKTEPGVAATKSGLQYQVIQEGTGDSPKPADKVKVNYSGKLLDGTEFDSSYQRGSPAVFQVDQVIPGWAESLQLMKTGGKYRIFIPSFLAYGERGASPRIPPNAMLIFDVELIAIEK